MRVLVTGTLGPVLPDGAWPPPAGRSPVRRSGPSPSDVARWWGTTAEADHADLAASGPAFLDALAGVAPELLAGVVPGPGGVEVPVALRRTAATGTVYADASQVPACEGPSTAGPVPRSSAATGHLLVLAAAAARTPEGRPGRVVLATGGARSHDAGAGLLQALAGAAASGGDLGDAPLTPDDLRAARAALGGVHLVAAVATSSPLLGLHGASAALADRGVDGALAQELERVLGAVAHDVTAAAAAVDRAAGGSVVGHDLLAPTSSRRPAQLPGAGSGGGTGFAVAALDGRLAPALRLVADEVGLDRRIEEADLVVVVADELGAHELGEGAVCEVARRAAPYAVPVVVLARSVAAGRREQAAAGLSGAYAWGDGAPRDLVARVARTWSRT